MRQSRHLGLGYQPIDLAQLAADIAITIYENRLIPTYSQQRRKGFLQTLMNYASYDYGTYTLNRPYSLKDLQAIDNTNNIFSNIADSQNNIAACDCSSFVTAVWYLTFLFGKSHINFRYSNSDPTYLGSRSIREDKPSVISNFGNPYTTFNMYGDFKNLYGFNVITFNSERDKIDLQPGDIVICHGGDGTGHTGIYVGDYKPKGSNEIKKYFIDCSGDEDESNAIHARTEFNGSGNGGQFSLFGQPNGTINQYVLRLKKTKTKKTPTFIDIESDKSISTQITPTTELLYRHPDWINSGNKWRQGAPGADYIVGNLQDDPQNRHAEVGIPFLYNPTELINNSEYILKGIDITINNAWFSHNDHGDDTFCYCLSNINLNGKEALLYKDTTSLYNTSLTSQYTTTPTYEFIEGDAENNSEYRTLKFQFQGSDIIPVPQNGDNNLYLYLYDHITNIHAVDPYINYHLKQTGSTAFNINIIYYYDQINIENNPLFPQG